MFPRPLQGAFRGDAALVRHLRNKVIPVGYAMAQGCRKPLPKGAAGYPAMRFRSMPQALSLRRLPASAGKPSGREEAGEGSAGSLKSGSLRATPADLFPISTKYSETKKNADFPRKRRVRNFFSMINPSSDGILCLQAGNAADVSDYPDPPRSISCGGLRAWPSGKWCLASQPAAVYRALPADSQGNLQPTYPRASSARRSPSVCTAECG